DRVEDFHVFQRGDGHARVADLAVDIRARVRVEPVERHRIERGREALRRHVFRQQVEALVGAERIALAREHARRILVLALEGKYSRGEGEGSGQVLAHAPFEDLAVVLETGQRDFRHLGPRKGNRVEPGTDFPLAYFDHLFFADVILFYLRPIVEEL